MLRAEITKSEGGGEPGTNYISIEGKEVYTVSDQRGGCAGGRESKISKIKQTSFVNGPWRQGMEAMRTRQDLTELSTHSWSGEATDAADVNDSMVAVC